LFEEVKQGELWKGYIVPSPQNTNSQGENWLPGENNNVIQAYQWLIDKAVRQHARTTPKDERQATAQVALLEGFSEYAPVYGSFGEYLSEKVKRRLIEHNKQYTQSNSYNTSSFKDIASKDGLLWPRYKDEMAAVEDKAEMDTFNKAYLTLQERKILKMLLYGYTVPEILGKHRLSAQELKELCQSIGDRWAEFRQVSIPQ